ncbi:MAG TPA: hypothetical protein VNM72_11140 [Blastocatellia bacterium]|nr:hypothetical protein [Blastocatellia bacterium]
MILAGAGIVGVGGGLAGVAHLALMSPELPRLVNFLLFVAALYYFFREPIAQFFRHRAETIRADLERARREREAARTKLNEIQLKLARLDDEVKQMKARAEAEAAAEYERVMESARREAEKIRALGLREIETARRAAEIELRTFAVERALAHARRMLCEQLTEDDHHRLVEAFIAELPEVMT